VTQPKFWSSFFFVFFWFFCFCFSFFFFSCFFSVVLFWFPLLDKIQHKCSGGKRYLYLFLSYLRDKRDPFLFPDFFSSMLPQEPTSAHPLLTWIFTRKMNTLSSSKRRGVVTSFTSQGSFLFSRSSGAFFLTPLNLMCHVLP